MSRRDASSLMVVTFPTTSLAIIGSGRVASSLGHVLRERGVPVRYVAGRNLEQARIAADFIGAGVEALPLESVPSLASRVVIAVSDAAIIPVAERLANAGFRRGIALHTAGSRGPEALAPLAAAGISTGVLYPLQTFPNPEQGARSLPGSYFAITGDHPAVAWARELVALIPGKVLSTEPAHWALYHAAAVMASNYQTTLLDAALEALERTGVSSEEGLAALAPIARATLENTLRMGPQAALTGPISRGDVETVRRNMHALRLVSQPTQDFYSAAGRRTIPIALRCGLPHAIAKILEDELESSL